jgi:hypothetical protein
MEKAMRLTDIRKKYRNQWVLVEFSNLDKDLRVKDGKVLAHAPNKRKSTKLCSLPEIKAYPSSTAVRCLKTPRWCSALQVPTESDKIFEGSVWGMEV